MERLFANTLTTLNALASAAIMFLIVLIAADVFGRVIFNSPLPGVPEIARFTIVGMFWMQMAFALRGEKHLRSTMLFGILPHQGRYAILLADSLVGACMFGFIVWLGWFELIKNWEIGAFEGEVPVRIPVWPVWGILVFGAALTAVQFVLNVVRFLCGRATPTELADAAEVDNEAV